MRAHVKEIAAFLVLVAVSPDTSECQLAGSHLREEYEKQAQTFLDEVKATKALDATAIAPVLDRRRAGRELLFLLALSRPRQEPPPLAVIEAARVDKQIGGAASNSGSTSLVSKGSVPAVLGLAVENGALARDVSGTTITFRGKPLGMLSALAGHDYDKSYPDLKSPEGFLNRFSFAVSFDAARGATSGTFTGGAEQLSSYSVRVDVVNKRDPRHSTYRDRWRKLQADAAQKNLIPQKEAADRLWLEAEFQAWQSLLPESLAATPDAQLGEAIERALFALSSLRVSTETRMAIDRFAASMMDLLTERASILDQAANGAIVTLDYTRQRDTDAPHLHVLTLAAEAPLWAGRGDLTANGSLSLYDQKPATAGGTVRDAQFGLQLDIPLGMMKDERRYVLSLAGKYQRLRDDPAATMQGGDVFLGQAKLTIPFQSGVKVPVSVTFANRTEFIKESDVRGNLGITLDLDAILAGRSR